MPSTDYGKPFHLGDILSITTGVLVSPDRMDGVYRVLNHMTGDNLYTHQLPPAADECRPALLDQHPDLAAIVPPEFDGPGDVEAWLATQVRRFGERRDVRPLAAGDHTSIDPITELRMRGIPDERIIPIALPAEGGV